jgi:hypothetical protein
MRGTKIKEGITKHSDILMLTCFITMCICVFALVLCYIYAGENAKLRMAFDVILFISIVLELIASAIYEKTEQSAWEDNITTAILGKYPNAEEISFEDNCFTVNGDKYSFDTKNIPNNWNKLSLKITRLTNGVEEIIIEKP